MRLNTYGGSSNEWVPGGQHYPQPERGTSCRRGHPGQERSFQQDLVAFGLVRNCLRAFSWVRKQDSPEDRKYAPQIADSESEIRCPSVVLGYLCREWTDSADTVGSSRRCQRNRLR